MPANALDSVAGTLVRGLIDTSNVAFEGSSAANRTSIGAERDANAAVSPMSKCEANPSLYIISSAHTERETRRAVYTS